MYLLNNFFDTDILVTVVDIHFHNLSQYDSIRIKFFYNVIKKK